VEGDRNRGREITEEERIEKRMERKEGI